SRVHLARSAQEGDPKTALILWNLAARVRSAEAQVIPFGGAGVRDRFHFILKLDLLANLVGHSGGIRRVLCERSRPEQRETRKQDEETTLGVHEEISRTFMRRQRPSILYPQSSILASTPQTRLVVAAVSWHIRRRSTRLQTFENGLRDSPI